MTYALASREGSSERRRALAEILLVVAGLSFVVWTDSRYVFPRPLRTANTILLGVVVAGILYRQRPSLMEWGLAPPGGSRAGLGELGALTGLLAGAAVVVGLILGSPRGVGETLSWAGENLVQQVLQQVLLQVVLWPRLSLLMGDGGGAVSAVSAMIFAGLHLPNPGLTLLTGPMAYVWCEWFRRYRNLPAVCASHALLAMSSVWAFWPYLGRLRVGIAYLWSSSAAGG